MCEVVTAPEGVSTYTPPEIAKLLRVDPSTVLGWIRSGELPAFKVNSRAKKRPRYRVRRCKLEEFLERREQANRPDPPRKKRQRPRNVTRYF